MRSTGKSYERLCACRWATPFTTRSLPDWLDRLNEVAERGDVKGADSILRRMETHDLSPKVRRMMFNTAIKACANASDPSSAEIYFREMRDNNCMPNMQTFSKLMNASAKAGQVRQAEEWLQAMKLSGFQPHAQAYSTMLNAAAKAQDLRAADRWYQQMLDAHIEPS